MAIVSQLEECLWPRGYARDMWMMVDSARDRKIFSLLLECFYSTHISLFAIPVHPQLQLVAPYLVQLDYDYAKTQKFLSKAWGNNWGVFLRCHTSQDTLRRHLRKFISVRDPRGQRMLFRFYDPRVLRTYLPTCSSQELDQFFGPVECFWTEGTNPEHLLELRLDGGKLVQRTISLSAGANRGAGPPPRSDRPARTSSELPFGFLTMRQAQMDAFSHVEVQKFHDWMCAHLTQFFPGQAKALGDAQLRELIRHGILRAAEYGITKERDVCKYIDLMIVLGRDFDQDKRLTWAGKILSTKEESRPKIRALHAAALHYLHYLRQS